jgi:aryl-alcohol dehydrogenase-like predicted oxidoreductase
MFEGYIEAGGNFFDTADTYQRGESESLLGEFSVGRREDLVIATKFSQGSGESGSVSRTGNSRKNMVRSLEDSLRRLKTDYVDIYWAHLSDETTSVDEIMRGFDDLTRAGKILYPGLSNFPAWRAARAATLASIRGSVPLAGVQLEYSLVERTPEHDVLPMARAFGLGAVAWSPLGGGLLTGKYRRGETGRRDTWKNLIHEEKSEKISSILDALDAVGEETNSNPGRVALSWIAHKGVIPIIGPRTREQLDDNLAAASLHLSDEQVRRLDEASAVRAGFPHSFYTRFPGARLSLRGGAPGRVEDSTVEAL